MSVKSEAYSVSSVLRHHRPKYITSLIGTPVLKHSSGRKARLLEVDSNETETTYLLLPRAGEKRKRVLTEASDKKFKKVTIRPVIIYFSNYKYIVILTGKACNTTLLMFDDLRGDKY